MNVATAPKFPHMVIPAFGTIAGGRFDGWAFTFRRLIVKQRRVLLEVLAHEPHWPFPPREPSLLSSKDFDRLRDASHRAPTLDVHTLIKSAMEAK